MAIFQNEVGQLQKFFNFLTISHLLSNIHFSSHWDNKNSLRLSILKFNSGKKSIFVDEIVLNYYFCMMCIFGADGHRTKSIFLNWSTVRQDPVFGRKKYFWSSIINSVTLLPLLLLPFAYQFVLLFFLSNQFEIAVYYKILHTFQIMLRPNLLLPLRLHQIELVRSNPLILNKTRTKNYKMNHY